MSGRSVAGVILVCTIWGLGFALMKVGLRYLPPFTYVGLRFVVTGLCVAALMRWSKVNWRVPGRARWKLVAVITMFYLQQGAIFWALTYTTAGRLGVILNTQPIITAVLAHWFVAQDRLTWGKVVGLLMAVSGIFFVFRESFAEANGMMRYGDLLALFAAISWGIQNIVTKHIVDDVPPMSLITWSSLIAGPAFLVTGFVVGTGPLPIQPLDLQFVGATSYIILVSTVFGFVAWVHLIERNPPSRVASFCFVTPIASLFFGWVILGERITTDILVAGGLVAFGIFIANYRFGRNGAEPATETPGEAPPCN